MGAMWWGSPFQTRTIEMIRNTTEANRNSEPPIELSVIAPSTLKTVWITNIAMCSASP